MTYSLTTIPKTIHKIPDPGHEPTESWFYHLVLRAEDDSLPEPTPHHLIVELYAGNTRMRTYEYHAPLLAMLRGVRLKPRPDDPPDANRHHAKQPEVWDLRLKCSEPTAAQITRMKCVLTVDLPDGRRVGLDLAVPIHTYEQKAKLIFPLTTPCLITQGHVNNGGHAEWSSQFAFDAMGLDASYNIMRSMEDTNEAYAGYGQAVIAPGGGLISYARNDVPENPDPNTPDQFLWLSLPEPVWASCGNCVVIDHGTGEFSFLSHLQHGSVTVRKGDRVEQGQMIGRLGNSGNSFGAHLHYHLMRGPVVFGFDPLPVKFENIGGMLERGAFVTPMRHS